MTNYHGCPNVSTIQGYLHAPRCMGMFPSVSMSILAWHGDPFLIVLLIKYACNQHPKDCLLVRST